MYISIYNMYNMLYMNKMNMYILYVIKIKYSNCLSYIRQHIYYRLYSTSLVLYSK